LDAGVLRRAVSEIVRRHEVLRTVFEVEGDEAVQRILPAGPVRFPVVDLSALPAERREAEAGRLVEAEARRPFDLARGPLLRATLVRLAEEDHAALFTLHHVVGDGWSMGILVRELSALYEAFARGGGSPLPELAIQYADYAVWQREHLSGEVLDAHLDYWRERLAGAPPLLELPTDHPRPARAEAPASTHPVVLSPELSRTLREVAKQEGATPFMVLLAAFGILLSRWSGQDDVVVGSPIAGRTRSEIEGLIGFFVNTLALRVELSGPEGATFAGVLAQVREATLGAYTHQELPFERLVEELHPERTLSHPPVFQVMLSLQNIEQSSLRLGDLRMEPVAPGQGVTQFDLDFSLADGREGILGTLRYRADLFEAATMERMAGHFLRLLEGVLRDPRAPLARISLLAPEERAQVVEAWNATAREYPRARTLHELVAEQAARTPDAPAVLFEDRALSYRELDRGADRLARRLRRHGVRPETRVGIVVGKSPEMALAALAVLRAGGACVPLDPAYPAGRLEYLLRDSGAALLLTREHLAGRFAGVGVPVLALDAEEEAADELAEAAAGEVDVAPEGVAYVIYTSGSTGEPKGVAVPHRALVNLAVDMVRRFGLGGNDRVLQFASPGFDVAVEEIFTAWLAGAALVLSRHDLFAPGALLRTIERHGVTALELPTAYWHEWVRELTEGGARLPESVRFVRVGGERVSSERLREWAAPGVPLVHVFGLTETACTSATLRLEAGDDGGRWSTLPVGAPTGNARLYVLDREGEPVPVGIPGELYVGGEGVARGYLGRPGLTAERFLPDPFVPGPGARLYRSGDRVRWLADGKLEFLGRIDHQVKVRGFRVEPGEVEAALERHPRVLEALVVVREDAPGDRRLAAYFTTEGEAPGTAELRAHLGATLPEHMVPSAFVALDAFPLTLNGKLDRRALPAPAGASGREYVPPRSETERVLAAAWAEVLRVERVGIHDSFFELGGHSLLATRLVSRVREAFGVELPLRALFEAPTVAGLAERVDAERPPEGPAEGAGAPGTANRMARLTPEQMRAFQKLLREKMEARQRAQRIPTAPRDRPLPLSFAQQRLWFIDQLHPGSTAYNLPTALRLRGRLEVPVLRASLDALVARHESLRTRLPTVDGSAVQWIEPPAPVPLPVLDLSALPDEAREAEVRRLARREARRPFDLARGPLLRATLVRLGAEDHAALFTLHHAVSDGWSMEVLVREVSALYEALAHGREPRLPELPVQYADYAVWQREHLSGEVLDAQLRWWRDRLAGAPPVLELPVDRPRRPIAGAPAANHPFLLPDGVARALQELARREEATPFMVLLAAFGLLLSRWSGQNDVVVGSPIAGRTRSETEGLIGFFVNTLVLRVDLESDPSFRGLLGRVREATLGAYQHQDLPFERLVESLGIERSLTHAPLFQAMFSLEDGAAEASAMRLGPVEAEPVLTGRASVKFDLTLSLCNRGGGLAGGLAFRADLWDRPTVERMLERFGALLDRVAADPDRRI
ncbi:MAG: amino acid adenylation domain-containing protein, partial [Gemmatimonadetes bacterium]|nr:amino acid adenylation domain-containing protein [Gemmatimonadota bacterium]